MRIKTQFTITLLLFTVMLAIIAAATIIVNQKAEKANEQEKIAGSIAQGATELNYLSDDYLIYREDQQLSRWQARFASFSSDIASLDVDKPEQQALVRSIQANQLRLKEVFGSIASALGGSSQGGAVDPAFLQVSWSRMTVQSQGLTSDALRLSQLLRAEAEQLTQMRDMLIYSMIGVFGAFLILGYIQIFRRTLRSITDLKAGTRTIGSGNLDYSIEEKKDDEFGELAHAFNRMTTNLRTVTASKADLEKEITERKRAEEALRQSQSLLHAVMETAPDPVFLKDIECRMLLANPATLRVVGKPAEQVIGHTDCEFYDDPKIGEAINENDRRVMLSGKIEVIEERALTPEGYRTYLSTKAPWFDADGRIVGLVGVGRDITERKRAEEALRKAHDELELRVQERTSELEESLKEKELLLKEIHHRVKNNMQVISSLLMLQEDFSTNGNITEMLKDSQNRISSMALIHERLYRSGNLSKIDLKDYVDDLVSGLFQSYGVSESRVALNINVENVSLVIDSAIPCGLVINELVSNSLKHAFPDDKKGEIKIFLRLTDEDMIELLVGDNGIGISKDMDIRKTRSLGLYLVTLLVENQLHGEVTLNRERGTEFLIKFREVK